LTSFIDVCKVLASFCALQNQTLGGKMNRKTMLILLVIILSLTMSSCKSDEDDNTLATALTTAPGDTSVELFTKAQQVGPVMEPTASSKLGSQNFEPLLATMSSGNVLYETYYIIRDYVYPRDEGTLDSSNMWKAIYTAGQKLETSVTSCTSMTEKSVASPYNFGGDGLNQNYNCAYSATDTTSDSTMKYVYSYATKKTDTRAYGMLGWVNENLSTGQVERKVMEVDVDPSGDALVVNHAYLVSYQDSTYYGVRLRVSGTISTGLFTLKLMKTNSGGFRITIVGYGYSTGAQYYLFKVTTQGAAADVTDAYYCFESSTTEVEVGAMDDAGSATVPTNCTAYSANLPTPYAIDASEVPDATSDFTGIGDYGIGLSL
jgi:hypothetical protein